jgi:putative membrane protein
MIRSDRLGWLPSIDSELGLAFLATNSPKHPCLWGLMHDCFFGFVKDLCILKAFILKTKLAFILVTLLCVPLSFVKAPYPNELVLQHIPTVVALIVMAMGVTFLKPTSCSFFCVICFLWLHLIGARWIYSFVPYDELSMRLTGVSISDQFGWERNHYDRMVHFASGILGVPPASEFLQKVCGVRSLIAACLAISIVLSVGAVYEIIEWLIAFQLPAAQAEAYNGQQGDMWDAQKDLALAGVGAVLSASFMGRWDARLAAT